MSSLPASFCSTLLFIHPRSSVGCLKVCVREEEEESRGGGEEGSGGGGWCFSWPADLSVSSVLEACRWCTCRGGRGDTCWVWLSHLCCGGPLASWHLASLIASLINYTAWDGANWSGEVPRRAVNSCCHHLFLSPEPRFTMTLGRGACCWTRWRLTRRKEGKSCVCTDILKIIFNRVFF